VEGSVEFHLEVKDKMLVCPECGSQQVWRRGKRTRHIKSVPIGSKPVVFVTEVPRCECRSARAGAAHLQNGILKAMTSGVSALRSLGSSLLKHAKHILSYLGPHYQRHDGRHQQDQQTATHRLWLGCRDESILFLWLLPFMNPRSPYRVLDCAPHQLP